VVNIDDRNEAKLLAELTDVTELLSIARDKKKHLSRQVVRVETEIIGYKVTLDRIKAQLKKIKDGR
jgi:hypothetical protein